MIQYHAALSKLSYCKRYLIAYSHKLQSKTLLIDTHNHEIRHLDHHRSKFQLSGWFYQLSCPIICDLFMFDSETYEIQYKNVP